MVGWKAQGPTLLVLNVNFVTPPMNAHFAYLKYVIRIVHKFVAPGFDVKYDFYFVRCFTYFRFSR